MNRHCKYLFWLSSSLVICFVLQYIALEYSGGRFNKNESNFFSSLGRIQAGAVGKPEVMILGSSITGRLPDRSHGFAGFANMGCDGGSAVDTLRAMDTGILPCAPKLLIEVNTLPLSLSIGSSEIGMAMRRPWFHVGMKIPLLSAYARPSGFFYSMLLSRRAGAYGSSSSNEDLRVTSVPETIEATNLPQCSEAEAALKGELLGILQRLKQNDHEIVFVWLPPTRGENDIPAWVRLLIADSKSLWWDLGNQADSSLVTLTDNVHMNAPSAARTVISLRKGLFRK